MRLAYVRTREQALTPRTAGIACVRVCVRTYTPCAVCACLVMAADDRIRACEE